MVYVASISGLSGAPFHATYGAAKAGPMSLGRTRDIASSILFKASDRAQCVTGHASVGGGLATTSPLGHAAPLVAVGASLADEEWPATNGGSHQ